MVAPRVLSVTARQRRRRPSLIDPYERYVLQWWQEGNRNSLQLYKELTAQGYRGSSKAMDRYLERLRTPQRHAFGSSPSKPHRRKSVLASPAPLENFSAQRARLSVWTSTRRSGLDAKSQVGVDQASQPQCRNGLQPGSSVHA